MVVKYLGGVTRGDIGMSMIIQVDVCYPGVLSYYCLQFTHVLLCILHLCSI